MSYDVWLEADLLGETVTVADCGNYTSNVGDMFARALAMRLGELDGQIAHFHIDRLSNGFKDMVRNEGSYTAMNPENGWGDYYGACDFLLNILTACKAHPLATIRVSA